MTQDFADELQEACEKEGVAYVLIVATKDSSGTNIRSNLDNWEARPGKTPFEELHEQIDLIESWELEDE